MSTPPDEPGVDPEVLALAELVQYQPGAVVSRTLIKKRSGTVTAFAFDAGEELSEHSAAFDALVFVVDGEAEITIAGSAYRVHHGEMIRLPANRPHSVRAVERFKMILTMIRE
jgi:quercetin dioxygenase-like cupin family protein